MLGTKYRIPLCLRVGFARESRCIQERDGIDITVIGAARLNPLDVAAIAPSFSWTKDERIPV